MSYHEQCFLPLACRIFFRLLKEHQITIANRRLYAIPFDRCWLNWGEWEFSKHYDTIPHMHFQSWDTVSLCLQCPWTMQMRNRKWVQSFCSNMYTVHTMQAPISFSSASTANDLKASRIGRYPVHRHILPPNEFSISSMVTFPSFASSKLYIFITMAGEQYPDEDTLTFDFKCLIKPLSQHTTLCSIWFP